MDLGRCHQKWTGHIHISPATGRLAPQQRLTRARCGGNAAFRRFHCGESAYGCEPESFGREAQPLINVSSRSLPIRPVLPPYSPG